MRYAKLGRTRGHRRALLRSLVTALLREERIETTETKARQITRLTDRMITLARRKDLHARRMVLRFVFDEDVVRKLFDTIGPRYAERQGGYTRVIRLGPRRGDAAPMAVVELV